jgi:hypothetical protein
MTHTIELPFAIGEQIWWAGDGFRQEWVTCPECAGTRVIEMIQGNGERVALDCECCRSGYEPSRGVVVRTRYEFKPVPFTPQRWRCDGDEFGFSESPPDAAHYTIVYAKDLFKDRDECLKRCAEKNAEHAAEDERRFMANLSSKRRSMAFSAHYWRGQVEKLRKELAMAEARLARCKQPKVA